jgi:FkbM family methyltransferase
MGMSMFLNTCQAILRNPSISPLQGLARHAAWHLVRRMAPLPLEVILTEKSRLVISRREEMNGCVALAWSQPLYNYDNMMFLLTLLDAGFARVCFDVGANIGVYSLLMSEVASTVVHAFEPHPATCTTLRRMLGSNGRQNVTVWPLALSDATGELRFTNDDCSPLNQALDPTLSSACEFIHVPCETGRSFCARQKITPDIIKIDTEGFETRVLRGFGDELQHVKMIITEINVPAHEVVAALPPDVFIGPCYVDALSKTLTHVCLHAEDAVFINRGSIAVLRDLGFQVVTEK